MKKTVKEAITNGAQVIIGHGREFSDVFAEKALEFPNVKFITIHGNSLYKNQSVYTFDQGEIEYFAALAASLKTRTHKVGLLDAFEGRQKNPEFETGLHYYSPNTKFYYETVNSRDDGQKAISLMKKMISEGVDVIYTKGNAYNQDVINYAKKANVYIIGYLDDQSYIAKNQVLTSVENDVSQAYVAIMSDYFSEKGIPSGKVMLDDSDGVYKLSPFGPMFSKQEIDFIQKEMKSYKKGEISFK